MALLQEKGAEPESKDSRGRTLLLWVAGSGHDVIVDLLR
jgi:ankyrin repeat protein